CARIRAGTTIFDYW
nr:immunoglobulin heavy chain junction region [Macaca mulatta]